jgi:predicted Rossmann fold nucleotide-binding protein DprA/Smf involved in DNA uptake
MTNKRWLAVVGTREVDGDIRCDIEEYVTVKIAEGYGIVSGGATGADHEAAQIAVREGLSAERFRIYLPTSLNIYIKALIRRGRDGKCDPGDAKETTTLLQQIAQNIPGVIYEGTFREVDAESFHARNCQIVDLADELVAFRTNMSPGATFTIEQATVKNIPTRVFDYER